MYYILCFAFHCIGPDVSFSWHYKTCFNVSHVVDNKLYQFSYLLILFILPLFPKNVFTGHRIRGF